MTRGKQRTSVQPQTLTTRHLFLDTQVYRQVWHNPESALLVALGQQIAAHRLVLYTTPA